MPIVFYSHSKNIYSILMQIAAYFLLSLPPAYCPLATADWRPPTGDCQLVTANW
jgi:hypothetical protein